MVASRRLPQRCGEEAGGSATPNDFRKLDPGVRRIVELVSRADLRHPPGLDSIARQLSISSIRLRRLFKEQVGMPFSRYVKLLRLKRAKQLLQTSSMRLKEVTAALGIEDMGQFARDYEKLFGETPSQTRRRSRSKMPFTGAAGC